MVTVQLYKKPAGKKKADFSAPLKLVILEVQKKEKIVKKPLLFLSLAAVGLVGCSQQFASRLQPKQDVIAAGETFGPHGANPARKRCLAIRNSLDRYATRGMAVAGFKFDTLRDTILVGGLVARWTAA